MSSDTALLISNLVLDWCRLMNRAEDMSVPDDLIRDVAKGVTKVKIFLVVSDVCFTPTVSVDVNEIKVTIGIGHDFDDILDATSGLLSAEQVGYIHRLWSDDDFPRNFTRIGEELIISARE